MHVKVIKAIFDGEKAAKLTVFKSFFLSIFQFSMMYVNETWPVGLMVPLGFPSKSARSLHEPFEAHAEAEKSCDFIPDVSWSTSNATEKVSFVFLAQTFTK